MLDLNINTRNHLCRSITRPHQHGKISLPNMHPTLVSCRMFHHQYGKVSLQALLLMYLYWLARRRSASRLAVQKRQYNATQQDCSRHARTTRQWQDPLGQSIQTARNQTLWQHTAHHISGRLFHGRERSVWSGPCDEEKRQENQNGVQLRRGSVRGTIKTAAECEHINNILLVVQNQCFEAIWKDREARAILLYNCR